MTLYDRIQKSRDTMVNQYCNKCRQDRYFCRHRSEFANPDPKQTYKVPLVSYASFCLQSSIYVLIAVMYDDMHACVPQSVTSKCPNLWHCMNAHVFTPP
jgi:hypothetical protein